MFNNSFFNIFSKSGTSGSVGDKGVLSVSYNSSNKQLSILLNDASIVTANLSSLQDFEKVNTFADLPDATLNATKIRIVLTTTGIIGINRKQAGMYYSDGVTWTRLDVNYDAEKTYYNNANSIFLSTNVKGALDEVSAEIEADRRVKHGIIGTHDEILITLNVDNTKFDVKPFDYYINGVKYSYMGGTAIPSGFTIGDDFQILGIGTSGLVFAPKNTFFNAEDLQTILEIGGFATSDGSTISVIGNSHFNGDEFIRDLYVWSKIVKKTNFIGLAGAITESITPLRLNISGGDIITPNLDLDIINSVNNIGMVAYHHIAGVWDLQPLVTPFIISNNMYDNGTDLVIANNNKWLSHTVARSSRTGTIYFIYSQAQYDNQAEAIDAPYSLGGFAGQVGSDVEPLAKLILEKGAASIETIIDIRNESGTIVSASTSTMQITYDRSSIPQVILATDKPIEYRNNLGDTNIILQSWKDNSGAVTYTKITKNGLIGTGLVMSSVTKTTDYSVTSLDYTIRVDASSNNVNITLPSATEIGRIYYIKRIDNSSFQCNILGTIDGTVNIQINKQYESLTLQANGSSWDII